MMLRWYQNTTAGICTVPRSTESYTAAGTRGKGGDGVECVRKKDAERRVTNAEDKIYSL